MIVIEANTKSTFPINFSHHDAFVKYPTLGTVRYGHVVKSETDRLFMKHFLFLVTVTVVMIDSCSAISNYSCGTSNEI